MRTQKIACTRIKYTECYSQIKSTSRIQDVRDKKLTMEKKT